MVVTACRLVADRPRHGQHNRPYCHARRPEDRFQEPADLVKELERIAKFQNLEV